ncbi:hypothetical protein PAU_01552 [Photorhabdus asymbiotica]|uniref:Uncharacterized protein n=1 Tax=Photorhabdus asymbiotica subsp. asymbiotica (strain ATCC 43949 / 3105-77) TaxID=553480 RepID=B6VKT4_PHOAA|nr:hypothetical protein PAU_01552 [Photorhabdus asymbiotica]CAR66764.1 hypothetical protein PA-RVA4-3932 [Photorhabdus asymbiotica subsp. asymbiotica ATCC 43949]
MGIYSKSDKDYINSFDPEVKNMLYKHILQPNKWDK